MQVSGDARLTCLKMNLTPACWGQSLPICCRYLQNGYLGLRYLNMHPSTCFELKGPLKDSSLGWIFLFNRSA